MYIDLMTINLCPGQSGGGVNPSGVLDITGNGVYNVYSYASVNVDVPQSGWDQKNVTEGTIEIINLNNDASFVASSAFQNNNTIQTVNLPYATSVGNNAFQGCSSLSQVSLPMCSNIGNTVFAKCDYLTQVSLPMCSYIGNAAFNTCYLLSQVSLPMCSYISNYAFRGCTALSIITIGYSSVCSLVNRSAFSNTQITSSTGSIYVPTSLVDSYKSATNWSYFSTQIFPISE